MSVPIATSPGRAGFGPELSLSYDSGAWNGLLHREQEFSSPPGNVTMNACLEGGGRLDAGAVEVVMLLCRYTVT
jgi:hypothetical protein